MKNVFQTYCLNPIKRMANEPKILVLGVFLTIVVGTVAFMLFERVGPHDGIYWTTTTMTSVGYGDLLATSPAAKLFTAAFQLWSLFILVPCAVANIIDSVRRDEHKMTHSEQEWLFGALEQINNTLTSRPLPPQPHDFE